MGRISEIIRENTEYTQYEIECVHEENAEKEIWDYIEREVVPDTQIYKPGGILNDWNDCREEILERIKKERGGQ